MNDNAETLPNEEYHPTDGKAFQLRDGWHVFTNPGGIVHIPTWNSRGAAEAYLDAVLSETRRSEIGR